MDSYLSGQKNIYSMFEATTLEFYYLCNTSVCVGGGGGLLLGVNNITCVFLCREIISLRYGRVVNRKLIKHQFLNLEFQRLNCSFTHYP